VFDYLVFGFIIVLIISLVKNCTGNSNVVDPILHVYSPCPVKSIQSFGLFLKQSLPYILFWPVFVVMFIVSLSKGIFS
jgi:hypothetical protein